MRQIGKEKESGGRHEKLKENDNSQKHAAHVFTTVNASRFKSICSDINLQLPLLIHDT